MDDCAGTGGVSFTSHNDKRADRPSVVANPFDGCHTVVALFVFNICSMRSRWTLIAPNVRLRAFASTNSGNQSRTNSSQSARLNGGPPGTRPAASAGATYLRTVPRSTPTLAATSAFGRPACQCCQISTTSIISNVLLAMFAPNSPVDEPGPTGTRNRTQGCSAVRHHPRAAA